MRLALDSPDRPATKDHHTQPFGPHKPIHCPPLPLPPYPITLLPLCPPLPSTPTPPHPQELLSLALRQADGGAFHFAWIEARKHRSVMRVREGVCCGWGVEMCATV